MILLILFAFLAGIITVLSPCILPVLPIVLSSTIGEKTDKKRPLGVITGFVLSFTFFTLFLSSIVSASGIPADSLRFISVLVILMLGMGLLLPAVQELLEKMFVRLSHLVPLTQNKSGFGGGIVIGMSLGLLWTPCVGPILASVISLAITGSVSLTTLMITAAYASGTAIPMLMIMVSGQKLLHKIPWLTSRLNTIRKAFGVLMILTAMGIYFNIDRKFQTFILDKFPNYGTGLTQLEDIAPIQQQLEKLRDEPLEEPEEMGKPMFEVMQKGPKAPELIQDGEWFNSEPLTLSELEGKVVVIDFWTYSCINCQRTLPYLKNWWERYKDKGLVIIGIHSPEFVFEKDAKNVAKAIQDFGILYPVMQDNEFRTWRAYENRYWPAKYFIDKEGSIRYTHFGEGAYDESERVIQTLLAESGAADLPQEQDNPDYTIYSRTPEIYLGYERMEYLAGDKVIRDKATNYHFPDKLADNYFSLNGRWMIAPEYALAESGSQLQLNFEAKEVFLVMRPKAEIPGKVKVSLDGKSLYLGRDVVNGVVEVTEDTLYKLINLAEPGRHLLQLDFLDDQVEIYAFTFG